MWPSRTWEASAAAGPVRPAGIRHTAIARKIPWWHREIVTLPKGLSGGPAMITAYDGTPTAFGVSIRAYFLAATT